MGVQPIWGYCQPCVRDSCVQNDQSPHPSLSLSPWTSCQARAPIPALSLMRLWGGSQRQEFEASAL